MKDVEFFSPVFNHSKWHPTVQLQYIVLRSMLSSVALLMLVLSWSDVTHLKTMQILDSDSDLRLFVGQPWWVVRNQSKSFPGFFAGHTPSWPRQDGNKLDPFPHPLIVTTRWRLTFLGSGIPTTKPSFLTIASVGGRTTWCQLIADRCRCGAS